MTLDEKQETPDHFYHFYLDRALKIWKYTLKKSRLLKTLRLIDVLISGN